MAISRKKLVELLVDVRPNLPDELALKYSAMYPLWKAGVEITQDMIDAGMNRFQHDSVLYKVLQPHTTQADWTPDAAPSLFAKVLIPDDTQIYPWEQPGSTNGYSIGDQVMHNGKTWESQVDNNVWEPGTVGTESLWAVISE